MLIFVVELIIIRVRGLSRTVGAKSDVGLIQTPPSCTKAQFGSGKWSLSMRVVLLLLREGSGNRISGVALRASVSIRGSNDSSPYGGPVLRLGSVEAAPACLP